MLNISKITTKNDLIYKYTSVTEHTFQTLLNTSLYFRIPKDVNDPFDCRFKLRPIGLTKEGVQSYYQYRNLRKEDIDAKIQLFHASPEKIENEIEVDYIQRLITQHAITCFSEERDNILMWVHYADNFRGICLIFKWKVHPEYFQGHKVQYKKDIPTISYDGNGMLEAGEIFLTKLDIWKYEKEVRSIVLLDGGKNPVKYNPKALTGVIFGNKVAPKSKEAIKGLIKMHPKYVGVKFYDANPNYQNKSVEIVEDFIGT